MEFKIISKFDLGDRVRYVEFETDFGTVVDINLTSTKKGKYKVLYTVKWDDDDVHSEEKIDEFDESLLVKADQPKE